MNKLARSLVDLKDLCERAGRCGMPTEEYMVEIDSMIEMLEAIKREFVAGKPVRGK